MIDPDQRRRGLGRSCRRLGTGPADCDRGPAFGAFPSLPCQAIPCVELALACRARNADHRYPGGGKGDEQPGNLGDRGAAIGVCWGSCRRITAGPLAVKDVRRTGRGGQRLAWTETGPPRQRHTAPLALVRRGGAHGCINLDGSVRSVVCGGTRACAGSRSSAGLARDDRPKRVYGARYLAGRHPCDSCLTGASDVAHAERLPGTFFGPPTLVDLVRHRAGDPASGLRPH